MSRTFRHIPFWARTMQPYQKSWKRLIELGILNNDPKFYQHDPRDKLLMGYDNGKGQSYYCCNFPARGFRENYRTEARKFIKRKYHKAFRRYYKIEVE